MRTTQILKIIALTLVWAISINKSYTQGGITIAYDQVLPCIKSVAIYPQGGTAPYTYNRVDASGNQVTPAFESSIHKFSAAGTYTVTIKDGGTGANQKTLEVPLYNWYTS